MLKHSLSIFKAWQKRIAIQAWKNIHKYVYQLGRSPKVVALFSATNFSSNIIELLQLHDTIQIR